MQISRHLLITCAVAACLTPTFIHAYDNEAQIRARQALDEQMKQMATQAPPATSAPPAAVSKPKSKPPVKVKEVKPAAPAPVAPAAPVMSAPATSNAADDQLTEALRQKMNETAPEPVKPPVVVKKTEPKPNKVKVVKVKPAPVQPQPAMVIETTKPATVENPPAQAAPAFAPEISQPATPAPAAPVMTAQAMPVPETTNPADARLTDALHQKMHEETGTDSDPRAAAAKSGEAEECQTGAAHSGEDCARATRDSRGGDTRAAVRPQFLHTRP